MDWSALELLRLGLWIVFIAISVTGGVLVGRHLRETPRIETHGDFVAFRAAVKQQMYLAASAVPILGAILVMIVAGLGAGSGLQALILWLPAPMLLLSGLVSLALEKRMKDASRCAPHMQDGFLALCKAWKKQWLPKLDDIGPSDSAMKPTALWHYVENDEEKGPVPEAELAERLASGSLTADTEVWTERLADWTRAAEVPELMKRRPVPPPIPRRPTPPPIPPR